MFHNYPNFFFTEQDVHSLLCDIVNEELRLHGVEPVYTLDGCEVNLVHHGYYTPFRYRVEGRKFEIGKGKPYERGNYDLVVLNPEFVENNIIEVVSAENFDTFEDAVREVKVPPLIWACEVVFFPRVKEIPNDAIMLVRQDALKIEATSRHKESIEDVNYCKMASVLVFTGHPAEEAALLARQLKDLENTVKVEIILSTA